MDTMRTTQNRSASCGCVASVTGDCIAKDDSLIAAAPDLYEALQRTIDDLVGAYAQAGDPDNPEGWSDVEAFETYQIAIAASAKANGDSS